MGSNRKLQTEINRVIKKISEGIDVFDTIWDKVYSAETQSQKEKHEGDLKKEIKKLQRLREQLKTWINSGDIRDKSQLIENRKKVEKKMEQFKICEKETKTKAFSKAGLAQAASLDPEQKAKIECRNWVQSICDEICQKCEAAEADIEVIESERKPNRSKLDDLTAMRDMHKYHIENLEKVMRALDTDVLTRHEVDALKDDLEYYLEGCDEPDFYHDESLYDELELDEKLRKQGKVVKSVVKDKPLSKKEKREAERKRKQKEKEVSNAEMERQKKHEGAFETAAGTAEASAEAAGRA